MTAGGTQFTPSSLPQRNQWLISIAMVASVGILLAVLISLVGSASDTAESDSAHSNAAPAHVEAIAGSDVSKVTLTEKAAERIDLQTSATGVIGSRAAQRLTIPYGAVIYDADGQAWAYTNPAGLEFVRVALDVDTIRGDEVLLNSGPEVGMPVVTVGAQEIFGAEFGVGH